MTRYYIPDDVTLEDIEDFLTKVTELIYREDEVYTRCWICNEIDRHSADCFVPAIKGWQEAK